MHSPYPTKLILAKNVVTLVTVPLRMPASCWWMGWLTIVWVTALEGAEPMQQNPPTPPFSLTHSLHHKMCRIFSLHCLTDGRYSCLLWLLLHLDWFQSSPAKTSCRQLNCWVTFLKVFWGGQVWRESLRGMIESKFGCFFWEWQTT